MQVITDIGFMTNFATVVFSILTGLYLYNLWRKQENRMYTDLPLMMSLSLVGQAVNHMIKTLAAMGIIEMTLDMFRIRTLVITATALPMLGMVLHIWLYKYRKYHVRTMGGFTLFWALVTLMGPTQNIIMMILIPPLIVLMVVMLTTFLITWKTGRLKEVRSDLMVGAALVGIVSQVLAGFVVVNNLLLAIGTIIGALALVNPWYHREQAALETVEVAPVSTYETPVPYE